MMKLLEAAYRRPYSKEVGLAEANPKRLIM